MGLQRSIGALSVPAAVARLCRVPGVLGWESRAWARRLSWATRVTLMERSKRVVDVGVSLVVLLLSCPLLLLVAIAVKLTDRGPVLYWQTRIGRFGQPFRFPKFRSMVVDAERQQQKLLAMSEREGVSFKMRCDPRITPVGRLLRRTSIDELPQLWSVLRGDMTLVGPRPPLPREVATYTVAERRRLDVMTGITCIWQVSGRADIPFARQVEMDVHYIENWSPWLDLSLLARTVSAVVSGRGAY